MSILDAFKQIEPLVRQIVREEIESALLANYETMESSSNAEIAKDLMNTKETAAYLGVSPLTVYRLRKENELGFYRVGSRILFSLKDHIRPHLETTEQRSRMGRKGREDIRADRIMHP